MGAHNFCYTVESSSLVDTFNNLVEDAIHDYGNDSYNGTISTCDLDSRASKSFPVYSKKTEKEGMAFVEKECYGEKCRCSYVDLGVSGYEVVTVKKETKKADAELRLKYCVQEYGPRGSLLGYKDTKAAADDLAIEYCLKGKDVHVEKKYINVKKNSSTETTSFTKETKRYKKKPTLKPMKNRVVRELHKYLLYGWAAE